MKAEIKNTIFARVTAMLLVAYQLVFSVACSDMLDTDSTRDLFDKELNQKTDSMFMAYGIMQAMQQLADQYVLTGEMRGDLTATTYYTNENLRQLADFSATASNRYDSAYVYYAVINNCNYYVAHRDTALYTGSTNVVINEYAAVKAFRAWAYLQLARTYGEVPFFTKPLTKISEINSGNHPTLTLDEIVAELAPDLEQYSGLPVPDYGEISCGSTNLGTAKTAQSRLCFIPVDVILGEMYLETNQYDKAAAHYTDYLIRNRITTGNHYGTVNMAWMGETAQLPNDFYLSVSSGNLWNQFFAQNGTQDIVTYIPMSVNRLRGTVSRLPELFGFRYLATNSDSSYTDEIQIAPSDTYTLLADSADYYYATDALGTTVKAAKLGDTRRAATFTLPSGDAANALPRMNKYNYANVVLYRNTTIYLHLAEAFNRLGHPDLSFAILKDGIDRQLLSSAYLTDESKQLLQTTYPFLSAENISIFDPTAGSLVTKVAYGIHKHGCGVTNGVLSPYQYDAVVGKKMAENPHLDGDTVSVMEELLLDEYAMEFAFEGNRFNDLCRLARHKNAVSASTGSQWLAGKLAYKHPTVSLLDEKNWYLPLK